MMKAAPLTEHRAQIANLGQKLFQVAGIEFSKTSELQRQICGAFLFGIVFAHGRFNQLQPSDVHALAICMLQDVAGYSAAQAGAFSAGLVKATSAGPNDTMNAIIHRGVDGHRQLTSGDSEGLRQNLLGIFKTLKAPYGSN